jgi:hypothetical protein
VPPSFVGGTIFDGAIAIIGKISLVCGPIAGR